MPTKTQTRDKRGRRCRAIHVPFWGLLIGILLIGQARADFIGYYAPGNWTPKNNNADGSVSSPDAGLSIVLTGGNNGSDNPGTTDFFISAAGAGMVAFDWSYSSLDQPSFDNAGFLHGNTFVLLADTSGEFGTTTFLVNSGEKIGFRVGTLDNTGEPGILTITDFSAPVPEPGTAPMVLPIIALIIAGQRRRRLIREKKEVHEVCSIPATQRIR
jgi:hypothetical protein